MSTKKLFSMAGIIASAIFGGVDAEAQTTQKQVLEDRDRYSAFEIMAQDTLVYAMPDAGKDTLWHFQSEDVLADFGDNKKLFIKNYISKFSPDIRMAVTGLDDDGDGFVSGKEKESIVQTIFIYSKASSEIASIVQSSDEIKTKYGKSMVKILNEDVNKYDSVQEAQEAFVEDFVKRVPYNPNYMKNKIKNRLSFK